MDKSPAKANISEWLSRSDRNDCTARMPSAPCRFSTTTGWPHFADSRSAKVRAVTSMPLPGPSGVIMRTLCCGQLGVCAQAADAIETARQQSRPRLSSDIRRIDVLPPAHGRQETIAERAWMNVLLKLAAVERAGYSATTLT